MAPDSKESCCTFNSTFLQVLEGFVSLAAGRAKVLSVLPLDAGGGDEFEGMVAALRPPNVLDGCSRGEGQWGCGLRRVGRAVGV